MSPFYILYDLRVAYSHLGSEESGEEKLKFVIERLGIIADSGLMEIYSSLIEKLRESFTTLAGAL